MTVKLRINSGKIAPIAVTLPEQDRAAIAKAAKSKAKSHRHPTLKGTFVISSNQSTHQKPSITRGRLTIKT